MTLDYRSRVECIGSCHGLGYEVRVNSTTMDDRPICMDSGGFLDSHSTTTELQYLFLIIPDSLLLLLVVVVVVLYEEHG